jgi:hypothetical protein
VSKMYSAVTSPASSPAHPADKVCCPSIRKEPFQMVFDAGCRFPLIALSIILLDQACCSVIQA